jgi:hypothetical protein
VFQRFFPVAEYDYEVVTLEFTKRRALTWALILAAWTLIVLTFAVQAYVFAVSRARADSFWHEFLVASSEWYVWAALTPLVLWLCRRFRITSRNWVTPVLLHLAAGIVISLLQLAVQVKLNFIVNPGYKLTFWRVLYFFATFKLHMNLLTYWVIVALKDRPQNAEYGRRRDSPVLRQRRTDQLFRMPPGQSEAGKRIGNSCAQDPMNHKRSTDAKKRRFLFEFPLRPLRPLR